MKNILTVILLSVAYTTNIFSQCTPPSPTGNPGLSPAPANVPCLERGVPYDYTLNFENFSSFNCSGFSVSINSATIDDLDNLPCGITWQADQSSYTAGETGCIRITGTTTDVVGQYPLTVSMTFNLNILGSPYTVSGSIPDLIQQMTAVGCSAPSINTNYFSRVIDPGTCPAIGTLPNGTSSGTTCPPTQQIAVSISGNNTICNGASTTLTANVTNSTGTVTYAWSTSDNTASVNVSPTTTTSYTVTVTDQNGSATASTSVTVNQEPNAAFTAATSGTTATITNTTTGATSYSWDFGDSQTSTAQNPPAHTYSSNGTFTITLIATNSCGSDTATQQVTISGGSGPSVSISGNTTICSGESTALTANVTNSTGTITYAWSTSGNTASINVSPTTTTSYTVTVTDQNGSATASTSVTVNQEPNAAFTATTSGISATITNTTTGATSYSWDFGDTQTSAAQNPPAHTYSSTGTFTITLIATNNCGNDTATQQVTISGGSGPSVSVSGNTTICAGESTTLTANPSNATGTIAYAWSTGGTTSSFNVSPTSSTTYSVTITAQNGSATASAIVTVNPKPNAVFAASTSGAVATITNATTNSTSYLWNFGDGQTSAAQNPTAHAYTSSGNFPITLIATSDCGSDTAIQIVNIIGVGISSIAPSPIALKIYPNPFSSTATVEAENITGAFDFALYSITGLKVYERTGLTEHKFTIDRNSLAQGVYFIEVRNEKILGRKKLVIY